MIILDTNVISELMRPQPEKRVLAWMAAQPRHILYTTCINQIEVFYGIRALPEGQRRSLLDQAAHAMFTQDFSGRILPFGVKAAACYPDIVVTRKNAGNPIEGFDALIAAIALSSHASVATRDTSGFAGIGLTLINPWV